jgi:hypothetical protein
MAKLPTFTAELGSAPAVGGRRASADDFGGQIGATIGAGLLRQVADDLSDAEQRNIIVRTTELRAQYAKELDDAAVSGADLEKIKQRMSDDLSKIGDNVSTRKGQDSLAIQAANVNAMFQNQANAVSVQRAGTEAKVAANSFLTSTAAMLQRNPAFLESAEQLTDEFVGTLGRVSPQQKAEIAQKLKSDLNVAAAMSAARLLPEEAKKAAEGGKWTLSSEERLKVIGMADSTILAKAADENHKRIMKEYDEAERDEKARGMHFKAIMEGTATAKAILDDANLKPATQEHMINVMELRDKELKERAKDSNPFTMRNLFLRIHAPGEDPKRIYTSEPILAELRRGNLNTRDAEQLMTMVAEQKDPNNRSIGSRIGTMLNTVGDAIAADPFYKFRSGLIAEIQNDYAFRVYEREKALRAAGKDPMTMFDPSSSDYVGSAAFIQGSVDHAKSKVRSQIPGLPDLRADPDAWRDLEIGDAFINFKGKTITLTEDHLTQLRENDQTAPAELAKPAVVARQAPPVAPASTPATAIDLRTDPEGWRNLKPGDYIKNSQGYTVQLTENRLKKMREDNPPKAPEPAKPAPKPPTPAKPATPAKPEIEVEGVPKPGPSASKTAVNLYSELARATKEADAAYALMKKTPDKSDKFVENVKKARTARDKMTKLREDYYKALREGN